MSTVPFLFLILATEYVKGGQSKLIHPRKFTAVQLTECLFFGFRGPTADLSGVVSLSSLTSSRILKCYNKLY